ncbi:Zn-ribbon domain-containing OB-fold protein [Actinocorallia longicatena]|uniref:OB-fold protein n=1 Tax=Actinocorallia longicatena TaxID=111803 RepID=A0ABP6QFK0_9ACTN
MAGTPQRTTDGPAPRIPLVDYLDLAGEPRLVVRECDGCGARFFDRRNACAACGLTGFHAAELPREGTVRTFTIVALAAPGVPAPFVAAVVDCGGTLVRGNLVNVDPDPDHVTLGMKVRLTTVPVGTDAAGTQAVGFGFEPA